MKQEFITPYMPQDNGVIERFFPSLKEECVFGHVFANVVEAKQAIAAWIRFYNHERPHSALGYKSPTQFFPLFLQEWLDKRGAVQPRAATPPASGWKPLNPQRPGCASQKRKTLACPI